MRKKLLYWSAQLLGWTLYIILTVLLNIGQEEFNIIFFANMAAVWINGIMVSHLLRFLFIHQGWLELGVKRLLPRVLPTIVLFGLGLEILYTISKLIISPSDINLEIQYQLSQSMSWAFLLLLWSLFYFSFHFFQNYRKEEIKNLQWEASKNEIELNRLKAQLNPHFIFNSMNTIRALVDENPKKSKEIITKLSKILRSTLISEKKKVISLADELELVKDYLDLEHSRFEERLNIEYQIESSTRKLSIPPMMLQTLVENSIKHGISKLPEGGTVCIKSSTKDGKLMLEIINSGEFQTNRIPVAESAGFGLVGTRKRLQLLYGDLASFSIENINGKVIAKLIIPQSINHEHNSNSSR